MTETRKEFETLEEKGLGNLIDENIGPSRLPKNFCYRKYAAIITNRDDVSPKFNVRVRDNPLVKMHSLGGVPSFPEVYLFPHMVSEDEARRRYSELK